ncbi:hypothetical protein QAD02_007742 [Eretmocerus hayati]|uniref:Uncharacterized protein n=1 Tax=Eretmocerus hayati TaxID=131215 RepID=A0ACC2N4H4_9HYME|nr:hypothetical protein QAD02_007742 [Eretmocerus hayati]
MANIYATIRGREKDIIQAYRKFPFGGTKKSSKSIEDEALNLYEIICDTLDRCRTQKNDCTGHKEALESMGDRMWRIHQILKDRRTRPDFGNVIFFESKTAFRRRARTAVVGNVDHITPSSFLHAAAKYVISYVYDFVKEHKTAKVALIFNAFYNFQDEKSEIKHFRNPYNEILISTNLEKWYKNVSDLLLDLLSEFEEMGSGWSLEEIISLKINIIKTRPLNAASFVDLPDFIKRKNAVINIECDRNDCFATAVMVGLYPAQTGSSRQSQKSSYTHWKHELKLNEEDFPISYPHIPKFERTNNISVNVYQADEEEESIYPSYRTTKKRARHVNLLLVERGDISHYCTIKHLSRLSSSGVNLHGHKVFICEICFHSFSSQSRLDRHSQDCKTMNECKITLPKEDEKILQFRDHWKKQDLPYIVYGDFECLLVKINEKSQENPHDSSRLISEDDDGDCDMVDIENLQNFKEKKSQLLADAFQKHEPYCVGLYFHDRYDDSRCFYKTFRGRDCAQQFVLELERIAVEVQNRIENFPPLVMSEEDEVRFQMAKTCHICGKEFQRDDIRVRDHMHRGPGSFRSAAHSICNLLYQEKFNIPIVFHNGSRYDTHHLILSLLHRLSTLEINHIYLLCLIDGKRGLGR